MKNLIAQRGNNTPAIKCFGKKNQLSLCQWISAVVLLSFISACGEQGSPAVPFTDGIAASDIAMLQQDPATDMNLPLPTTDAQASRAGAEAFDIFAPYSPPIIGYLPTTYTSVTSGGSHSCAIGSNLTATNFVACWGLNLSGQLGNGSNVNKIRPTRVLGLTNIIQVEAGAAHTCTLGLDGKIQCWGANSEGQLGNGFWASSVSPVTVPNIIGSSNLTLGRAHSCVVKADGGVACWGDNSYGQLGNGTTTSSNTPVDVIGLTNVKILKAGERHTCAITTDTETLCWGGLWYTHRWEEEEKTITPTPRHMGRSDATQLALGSGFNCSIDSNRVVGCYSSIQNHTGGVLIFSSNPLNDVATIDGYGRQMCAVKTDGSVRCHGQVYGISFGDTHGGYVFPGLTSVKAIGTGNEHNCAIKTSGSLVCWGSNSFGQLGNGTYTDKVLP